MDQPVPPLKPHTARWYDRLATMQEGYFHPWKSQVSDHNGESAYLELVNEHMRPNFHVLDIACGHGGVAIDIAGRCEAVVGYDRVPAFVDLARAEAERRSIRNVEFICGDSSPEANGGRPHIPIEDRQFDLVICRRGGLHWIEDARRVARSGASVIALHVPGGVEPSPWVHEFAPRYQMPGPRLDWVKARLAAGGLTFHSAWTFDVPELFDDPLEYYKMLSFGYLPGEVASYEDALPGLERIFAEHGAGGRLTDRHRRLLWKAVAP